MKDDSHLFPASKEESPMYHTLFGIVTSTPDPSMQSKPFVMAIKEGSFDTITGEEGEVVEYYDMMEPDTDKLKGCLITIYQARYGNMCGTFSVEPHGLVRVADDMIDAYNEL